MFRITRGPSSGSFTQCLAKITIMVIVIVTKHCIKLPDDGYLVIRYMLDNF